MTSARPSILLILTDQQRYDSLGCYGAPGVHTPNLDRLAAEGTRFDRCYVTNQICTPSRASLWTGKHLPGHGVYRVHDVLPPDEVLFSRRLRDAGYDTALFGKLHVAGHMREAQQRHPNDGFRLYEWTPDPPGFGGRVETAYLKWLAERHPDVRERFRALNARPGNLPVEAHMTTWCAERTIAYLEREREPGKPFLCCMSVFDPHDPYCNYPLEMRARLDEKRLAPPVDADGPFEDRPDAFHREREGCYYQRARELDADGRREMRAGYHAAVALIDDQVGRVLAALREQGLDANTLVIFASDHGDMLGDHGLLVKGCYFHDPCTRVPLILRDPSGAGGAVVEAFAQPHDIAATALLAAGFDETDVRRWMPDALDLRRPEPLHERGYAACLYRNSGICVDRAKGSKGYFDPPLHATMWREGRFKLNLYHAAPEGTCPGELFDLEADPREMKNLWADPAFRETRERMALRMLDWLAIQEYQGRGQGEDASPQDAAYRSGRG